MANIRKAILLLSLGGSAIFLSALLLSVIRPDLIEKWMTAMLRNEVEERVREEMQSPTLLLPRLAARWILKNDEDIRAAKESLRGLSKRVLSEGEDCRCAEFVRTTTISMLKTRVGQLAASNSRLSQLIREKYTHVRAALLHEFRIFTAANTLVFMLLGVAGLLQRRAALQLILPAVVLISSAAIVATIYLFGQDWLRTVIFSDYVGWSYLGYLAVAIVFIGDIIMNRARVSTIVFNVVSNLFGAALQAIPC